MSEGGIADRCWPSIVIYSSNFVVNSLVSDRGSRVVIGVRGKAERLSASISIKSSTP